MGRKSFERAVVHGVVTIPSSKPTELGGLADEEWLQTCMTRGSLIRSSVCLLRGSSSMAHHGTNLMGCHTFLRYAIQHGRMRGNAWERTEVPNPW